MKIDADTFSTREVTIDIPATSLAPSVAGHDVLILRVVGLAGAHGRPVSRSIRIPVDMIDRVDNWN